ncbi:cytochrome P450 CYP621A2 [Diaporthe sp. PMI_573]|nr:cytochrome P450 CYP621A2 [Diaporthaceae sp. PMI_573]
MLSIFPSVILLALFTLVSSALLRSVALKARRKGLPLPPGPPTSWAFGHLNVVPKSSPEWQFTKWSKEYNSDVLYFNMVVQNVVVLNSTKAAMDLLDKRGLNYGDRPRFVLFEIMGWRRTMAFMQWGPLFRLHRKVMQGNLSKSNITQFRPVQERESRSLVREIYHDPEKWELLLRKFATAVVLNIGFGVEIDELKGKYMIMAEDASYALGHGGPPAGTIVDFFPWLRHLPDWLLRNQPVKFAREWHDAVRRLHDVPYDDVVASGKKGIAFVQSLLDQRQADMEKGLEPELSVDDIKGIAVAVFAAGQDTTWAATMVFIFNMVTNPDIQAKAQQIIDDVVGVDRLPSFEDRHNLRYIDFLVQETLRWCPVSPLGLPHRSLEDDVYDGMFIPKGSILYANARAMTHDERLYQDPERFEPERYIPAEEGGRAEPFPRGQFGFGRRVCVGQHLAEASMWIVIARLLASYDVTKALDEKGKEIEPRLKLSDGLTSHPEGFPCRFVPRAIRTAVIEQE